MGPREAAVAAELIGARRIVASHYATFPLLTGTPEALRELLARGRRAARAGPGRDARAVTPAASAGSGEPVAGCPSSRSRAPSTSRERSSWTASATSTALREAHARGTPVVVRAATLEEVTAALARPEVACVLVTDAALLDVDLADITYG